LDYSTVRTLMNSRMSSYEQSLKEVLDTFEDGSTQSEQDRDNLIEIIALEIANDITIVNQYKLGASSTYSEKVVDGFLNFLRDLRNSLNLYVSCRNKR